MHLKGVMHREPIEYVAILSENEPTRSGTCKYYERRDERTALVRCMWAPTNPLLGGELRCNCTEKRSSEHLCLRLYVIKSF